MSDDLRNPEGWPNIFSDQRVDLPVNLLLDSSGPTLALSDFLLLLQVSRAGAELDVEKPGFFASLDILSDDFVRAIHAEGGDGALFRLKFLMMSAAESDNRHFCSYLRDTMLLASVFAAREAALFEPDNALLPADPGIDRFAHNVLNPDLSRKLFNPGVHDGYLVYGLNRPRVLVSMPFKAGSEYTYDVYRNSLDVATSLNMRGYFGTFLMFDYLEGLGRDIDGVPAWLIFFSLIATHADAVLFVAEGAGGLTDAQRREAALTPDRVPKKIVTLRENELTWAKSDDTPPGLEVMHIGEKGIMSKDDALERDAAFAMPMIEQYERGSFPNDRLIVLGDGSVLELFPDGRRVERRF